MSIHVITFSPTGGTQQVADLIASQFEGEKKTFDLLQQDTDFAGYGIAADDVCIIAVPSFGGRVPLPAVERLSQMKGNGAKAVLACVFGNRAYEDTLIELKDEAKAAGFAPVAAVAAVANHSIFRQFAVGRPDEQGQAEIKGFAQQIAAAIAAGNALAEVAVPGNTPYKERGGLPMRPETSDDCTACGICVEACPVGAIEADDPKVTDAAACITCMRCVSVCPQSAKQLNAAMLAGAAMKMAPLFETRKANELFIG